MIPCDDKGFQVLDKTIKDFRLFLESVIRSLVEIIISKIEKYNCDLGFQFFGWFLSRGLGVLSVVVMFQVFRLVGLDVPPIYDIIVSFLLAGV